MAEPKGPTDATFGACVARLRAKANLTVEQAANEAGMEVSMWEQIESGTTAVKIPGLWNIAKALGVEIKELLK